MGDAEGLSVSEACLCNIEHFHGGPEGFPGLCTEQNRVRNEQKEDRKKGQEDNGEEKDAPAGIEFLLIRASIAFSLSGTGTHTGTGTRSRAAGLNRIPDADRTGQAQASRWCSGRY